MRYIIERKSPKISVNKFKIKTPAHRGFLFVMLFRSDGDCLNSQNALISM